MVWYFISWILGYLAEIDFNCFPAMYDKKKFVITVINEVNWRNLEMECYFSMNSLLHYTVFKRLVYIKRNNLYNLKETIFYSTPVWVWNSLVNKQIFCSQCFFFLTELELCGYFNLEMVFENKFPDVKSRFTKAHS